jgi:2-keto-3-deoxy-L-rhamnonate aldolase RhmA
MNKIRKKLAAGKVVTMFYADYRSPHVVEQLAAFGLDVCMIDGERSSFDFERIEEIARAARAAGITSIARPWMNEPGLITRYLDCGIDGIVAPHTESAADARRIVEIVRYARPKDHADKLVVVMAETPAAIGKIGEIAAVPGVDVIIIGVNDVAFVLGHPGEPEHPAVAKVVDAGIERILKARKTAALSVLNNWEERMPVLIGKGVRWLNVRANAFLARGARQYMDLLRRSTPRKRSRIRKAVRRVDHRNA